MLHKHELDEEIAALENLKNHKPSELSYLGALYAVRDHAFTSNDVAYEKSYSQASAPIAAPATLGNYGDSDFLVVVAGKVPSDAWGIMDDLMDTLRVVNPRVYESVMRKMKQL